MKKRGVATTGWSLGEIQSVTKLYFIYFLRKEKEHTQ
jgi:hypothetical protein